MQALLAASRVIDALSRRTSLVATWLVLLAAIVSALNALFRYSISSVIWLDTKLRVFGGVLFLVPMCLVLIYFSWPWFLESWNGNEMSANAGGMPRWPFKIFLPLGFALLLLQGISEIIKCTASLTSNYQREHHYEKPVQ